LLGGACPACALVALGSAGLCCGLAEVGAGLLPPVGELDRPAMGALVFADESARRRLEAIVHPLVFERIVALEADAPPGAVVVHDIPLLAESGRSTEPDRGGFAAVVVVEAPADVQLQRMVRDRGWTEADALARIAAQATPEERRAIATHLVENTGTLEDLRQRVTEVFEERSD
jgi:dephospho-CoA kinase